MRVALCLSGQPRTWRHTWRAAFDFFAGHEIDVFIHTWDETDPAELQDLKATYAPRVFRVEPRPLFLAEKRRMAELFPVSPPFTIFDMFHSMAASVELALDAGEAGRPYDVICRSRFDLAHDGRWSGERPPENTLVVPAAGDLEGSACNDQFAIGDPAAMRLYAGLSAWLPDGMGDLRGPLFRPEIVLKHYLTTIRGLTIDRRPLAAVLLRPDQVGNPFAQLRDEPMFHAIKREEWEAFAKTHALRGAHGELDFEHYGRTPLALDRWLIGLPVEQRQILLTLAWPDRIVAIDRLLGDELGRTAMDADRYGMVRLICAALVHRMARDEPMSAPSFIVHALSANSLDMRRAQRWLQEDGGSIEQVIQALAGAPMLAAALQFAPALDQPASMGWRVD